jgi:hypothetical protein
MKKEFKPENIAFLDSIDYIDDKILAEVLADVKVPKDGADNGKPRRAWKQIAVFAACMVLLGALFPVVTWIIGKVGITLGGNPAGTQDPLIENTSQDAEATEQDHNVYLIPYHTRTLMSYNTVTGEYTDIELFKPFSTYTVYNGKIYYFHSKTVSNDILSCYDIKTGESIDLFKLPAKRYSHLVASDGFIYFSTNKSAYRIPADGGEAESLFDIEGPESIFCVIGRKVITVNRFGTTINSSTSEKSTIMAFDLDTRKKEIVWSAEDTEYGMIWEIQNVGGTLYLKITKNGIDGYVLLKLDIEAGEVTPLLENISSYFITTEGIYYHLFELRTINWHSMWSSFLGDQGTPNSPELYKCDFDGKNSEVIFTNSDFASLSCIIKDGKMIGSFCGDFPQLGWKRAYLIISIDLSTGKLTLIEKPQFNNFESEQIN